MDGINPNEKYPSSFCVIIDIINSNKSSTNDQDTFSKQLDNTLKQSLALFRDNNEFQQTINEFGKFYCFLFFIKYLFFF